MIEYARSSVRRIAWLATLVLLIGGAAAPSRASAARAGDHQLMLSRVASQRGWIHATSDGGSHQISTPPRTPSDFLKGRDARTALRAETFMQFERKALSGKWGITFPDPLAEAQKQRAARKAAGQPTDSFTIHLVYAYPAGDLDGDGLPDIITEDTLYTISTNDQGFTFDVTSDVVKAVKGNTGATLWTISAQHAYAGLALPVSDLNGDAKADVLLVNFTEDSLSGPFNCVAKFVAACAGAQSATYHWTTSALSGIDGSTLWSRTFPGTATLHRGFGDALVGGAEAAIFQSTNNVVLPQIATDGNGDGAVDFTYNAYDITEAWVIAVAVPVVGIVLAFADLPLITTHADLTEGRDGKVLLTESYGPDLGGAQLSPAGNADGDGAGDLLWVTNRSEFTPFVCAFSFVGGCATAQMAQADITMIDGTTLKTAWTRSINDQGVIYVAVQPALADLNGDGKADLLLDEFTGSAASQTEVQGVMSGADGSTVWSKPMSGFPAVVAPIGGGPGQDLLVLGFTFDSNTGDMSTQLDRVDGATGDTLLSTTHTYPTADGFTSLVVYLPGDLDGDGVQDVVFDSQTQSFATNNFHSNMIAESGKLGTVLTTRDVDALAVTFPAGDLNADGRQDLYDVQYDFTNNMTHVKTMLMPSGSPSWQRDDAFASPWFFASAFGAADLNGDGRTDALYFRGEQDTLTPNELARVDVLDGASGGTIWGFGDPT